METPVTQLTPLQLRDRNDWSMSNSDGPWRHLPTLPRSTSNWWSEVSVPNWTFVAIAVLFVVILSSSGMLMMTRVPPGY